MEKVVEDGESLNLVFAMDDVICTPHADINASRPIANVTEFMQWLKKLGHHITIWSTRLNDHHRLIRAEITILLGILAYLLLLFHNL